MREIKFRAWNKPSEVMCDYSTLQEWMFREAESAIVEYDIGVEREKTATREYGHLIFMQYTGLKDKNGQEIYEGDSGKCPDLGDDVTVVEYYNYGFYLKHRGYYSELSFGGEIIGNIYENPELIKK